MKFVDVSHRRYSGVDAEECYAERATSRGFERACCSNPSEDAGPVAVSAVAVAVHMARKLCTQRKFRKRTQTNNTRHELTVLLRASYEAVVVSTCFGPLFERRCVIRCFNNLVTFGSSGITFAIGIRTSVHNS